MIFANPKRTAGIFGNAGIYGQAGLYSPGGFNPLSLDPYLLFDTRDSMLDELESPALFLDSVPLLKNLADPSGATDAKQFTATNQPTALPLIDGKGYLYLSGSGTNSARLDPADGIDLLGDFAIQMELTSRDIGVNALRPLGRRNGDNGYLLATGDTGLLTLFIGSGTTLNSKILGTLTPASDGYLKFIITYQQSTGSVNLYQSNVRGVEPTLTDTDSIGIFTPTTTNNTTIIGAGDTLGTQAVEGAIHTVRIWKDTTDFSTTPALDVDFTSPNVRHGATKFECATGQVVTINQSGQNPATVIKKPVLRFDGVDDFMEGVLGQTVTGGYMFAAFSVLGDGGEEYGRILGLNSTGSLDSGAGGVAFRRNVSTNDWMIRYNENNITTHSDFFDDERGDYLLEAKVLTGSQKSKINNADLVTGSVTGQLNAEEFGIGAITNGVNHRASIDLEYLALFPSSITDAQADSVRNYINDRNNVFDLKDGFGYYFFDPQSLADGAVTSWNGRIIGSDNGDTDKLATQATAADQPQSDGYVVTFADATDHLDLPSTTQAGWQVVGTSLGTFAYRVDNDAVTTLNLLGNAGNYRSVGDSYGIILLPESATGADIEEARKLLIDRGAADGFAGANMYRVFDTRRDIVDFKYIDTSVSSNANYTWRNCSSMESFPALDLSNSNSFTSAWQGCSSLTSFPAGAKLGTEASNVNFSNAWQSSGLTSFSTPLPTATNASYAWFNCSSLTDFSADVFANWNPSSINSGVFNQAWDGCSSLTAQSVENILVSIDASGKYATSTGLSGGSALANAGIDIDYDGTTLSAATNAAVTSLKSKGWSIIVNNVTL